MKISDYTLLEKIEAYALSILPQNELHSLEEHLINDPEAKDYLNFFWEFESQKEAFGRFLLKQELKYIDKHTSVKFSSNS